MKEVTFAANTETLGTLLAIAFVIPLTLAACFSKYNVASTTPEGSVAPAVPTSVWSGLLQQAPYPYSKPLPPAESTVLDGIYAKLDPRQSAHDPLPEGRVSMPHFTREGVFWFKPVPYPLEGGAWNLQLDRGVFRVVHETTGWRTFGSFTVAEDRIEFFNDPHCYDAVGIYTWKLEAGRLTLKSIEDKCDGRVLGGGDLRVVNFSSHPWMLDNSRMEK